MHCHKRRLFVSIEFIYANTHNFYSYGCNRRVESMLSTLMLGFPPHLLSLLSNLDFRSLNGFFISSLYTCNTSIKVSAISSFHDAYRHIHTDNFCRFLFILRISLRTHAFCVANISLSAAINESGHPI